MSATTYNLQGMSKELLKQLHGELLPALQFTGSKKGRRELEKLLDAIEAELGRRVTSQEDRADEG